MQTRRKRPKKVALKLGLRARPSRPVAKPAGLIDEVRKYVRDFKKFYNTCADCLDEYPPYVLEFDHVDPSTKVFNVGHAASAPSMEALVREIKKCDVVCSNCHKIREYKRKKDPSFIP